jgi:hypothetical protein
MTADQTIDITGQGAANNELRMQAGYIEVIG